MSAGLPSLFMLTNVEMPERLRSSKRPQYVQFSCLKGRAPSGKPALVGRRRLEPKRLSFKDAMSGQRQFPGRLATMHTTVVGSPISSPKFIDCVHIPLTAFFECAPFFTCLRRCLHLPDPSTISNRKHKHPYLPVPGVGVLKRSA